MSAIPLKAEHIYAAAADIGGSAAVAWTLPPPISGHELREARLSPRCIVENYLFADVAALIAPGASSKTTMSLYEAICIVLGRPLWGLAVHSPGPVLFVTAEDAREYLVARLRRICEAMRLTDGELDTVTQSIRIADCSAAVRRLTAIERDVVIVAEFAAELVEVCIREGFRPALVQFDPMVSFGVGESRVNDAEQGLIHAARVITKGLDCAVRFVHHTGVSKALEKVIHQYAGRGGSALADGCRMVHVVSAVTDDELYKATGERLGDGQSALMLSRPKISYAPQQIVPLYIRRTGFQFEHLQALNAPNPADRPRLVGEQLARFLAAELVDGKRHTRNTLDSLRPESLSRPDVRTGLAWLQSMGRLQDVPIVLEGGKTPARGQRSYLVAAGEPPAR